MTVKADYLTVKSSLEEMICQGVLRRGSLAPSDRELARKFQTSLSTVQRAFGLLASEGKVVRLARKGTVIASDVQQVSSVRTWATFVPSMKYFYPPLVHTIEQEAQARGISLTVRCTGTDHELEQRLVRRAVENGAEGILLAPNRPLEGARRDVQTLEYLGDLPTPVVMIDHVGGETPTVGVDCVLSDNFSGCYESTAHLIWHGRKRIGFFRTPDPGRPESPEDIHRRRGYESALADHNLSIPDLPPLHNWDIDYQPEAIRRYLDAGVDAFVLTTDICAAMLIRLLNRWGLKMPDDVAIIGYDDEPLAVVTDPSLSSVRVPKEEIAKKAVQLLEERIQNKTKGDFRTVILRPRLVTRQSCGKDCPLRETSSDVRTPQARVSTYAG